MLPPGILDHRAGAAFEGLEEGRMSIGEGRPEGETRVIGVGIAEIRVPMNPKLQKWPGSEACRCALWHICDTQPPSG